MNNKYLITGASGLLGKKIFDQLEKKSEVLGVDIRNDNNKRIEVVDITGQRMAKIIRRFKPSVIIHTAAVSSPDLCEENPEKAWKINFKGTEYLANLSNKENAIFIFTSSLHVFDGRTGNYKEEDAANPINVYGRTKLEAEKVVKKINKNNLILRLSTLYGFNGKSNNGILDTIKKLKNGDEVIGLGDVFRNFTLIDDIASGILNLLKNKQQGIFHFCNYKTCSDYEFNIELANVFGLDKNLVVPQKGKQFYPKNTTLNTEKIKVLGIRMRTIEKGLKVVREQFLSGGFLNS